MARTAEERKIKETQRQLEADFRAVLATPAGLRVFMYLLDDVTGVVPPKSIGAGTEAEMAVSAGKQKTGHKILLDVERMAPDAYLEIMTARVRNLKEDEALRASKEKDENEEPE